MSNINETLKSKTVFVTGATSGIGEATAKYLASVGANIIIFGRSEENGKRVENEINKLGVGKALFTKGDVTSEEDQKRALEQGEKTFGAIHFAFSNAGTNNTSEGLLSTPLNDFRNLFDINFFGSFITLQQVAPYFKKNGGGVIVFNSSILGLFTRSVWKQQEVLSSYSITKSAVDGLVKVATSLEKSNNIKAYSVNPSIFITNLTQNERSNASDFAEQGNLIFKKYGEPNDIGKVLEHVFDGTTKYLSGTGIVCENEYTFSSQVFYDKYLTEQGVDVNDIIHNHLRDSRGDKFSQKQIEEIEEKIKKINEFNKTRKQKTN